MEAGRGDIISRRFCKSLPIFRYIFGINEYRRNLYRYRKPTGFDSLHHSYRRITAAGLICFYDSTHQHIHPHNHDDTHIHADGSVNLKEVKALLIYMISHNEHHAEELAALIDSLPKNAQKKLLTAIGTFEAANVELQEVLAYIE